MSEGKYQPKPEARCIVTQSLSPPRTRGSVHKDCGMVSLAILDAHLAVYYYHCLCFTLWPQCSQILIIIFFVVCILKPEAMFLRANQRFNLMRKSLVISLPSDLTGRCWVVTNHGLYFLKWICFPAELTQVSNSCLLQMFFIFIHRSEISYFLSGKLPILTKLLHFPWYQHALSMGDLKIRIKSSWEYILGSSCYENTPTLE